jgi:Putative metallopeptidase
MTAPRLTGIWAAALSALLSASTPALGQDDPTRSAIEFAVGNVEFLALHEIGHFLIAEKEVPILGPVENAADYIATLALLREAPLDPALNDRALRSLLAAADAFAASWQVGSSVSADVPYWGVHSLSIQRFYQIACLLYGSNPQTFAAVPAMAGLPPERAAGCKAEYDRAERAIGWLLDNYGRRPGDPPGARAEVLYEPAPTRVAARIADELKSQRLLELIVERLHERFMLARPFTVVLRTCGRAEAAWLPDRRELVICYDLLDTLYLLGLKKAGNRLSPAAQPAK